jgi:hypothetical protein
MAALMVLLHRIIILHCNKLLWPGTECAVKAEFQEIGMTTTTFTQIRHHGHDRLAVSFMDSLRTFVTRLTHVDKAAPDALQGPLAGRRWCDSTERELLAGLGHRRSILD